MSARQTIDSMHFAKSGGRLSGELHGEKCVEQMPRLGDILQRENAAVQYRLSGAMQAGRPALHLEVWVTVRLICQRCLDPYNEELALDRTYPIARDESELARWERDDPLLEALVADPRMVVAELVEDEILLSVPAVPRHPDGECGCERQVRIQ